MSKTLREIAKLTGGTVLGNDTLRISGITNSENPKPGFITFIQDPKHLKDLEASDIGCILVPPSVTASSKPLIQVANPKAAWAKLLSVFYPAKVYKPEVSDKASVAKSAKIGNNVTVEPFASIGERAVIGDGSVLRSFSFVDEDVKIGNGCLLHPGVVIYRECVLGNSVIVHAGTVIGADGFGYVAGKEGQLKVPQVGNVVIADDVEIGALVTIDRATVGSTEIGRGTKIDNQVQIAHNVSIGSHSAISAQTGISGSSKVGSYVTMGGKVGLGDHVEIGDGTMVGAGAGFPSGKRVPARQIVFGQPARPYQEARRQIAAQLRSAEMLEDIRKLKKRIAELEELLKKPAV